MPHAPAAPISHRRRWSLWMAKAKTDVMMIAAMTNSTGCEIHIAREPAMASATSVRGLASSSRLL
jgi:hypothetical protein